MREHLKNPLTWLRGLVAAFITGGATAMLGAGGIAAAHGFGVEVPVLNWKAMVIVFVAGAIPGTASYLLKSPLPEIISTETTITTSEVIVTHSAKPESPPPGTT